MKKQKDDRNQRSDFKRKYREDSYQNMIRNLEKENSGLFEEINILKAKAKKVGELQNKIDMILKHNNQLLIENERLAKLQSYKKQEIEVWRNKHEQFITNRSLAIESQIKRLMNELERAREQCSKTQKARVSDINILEDKYHQEIQQIKRIGINNEEKYKFEIKQLKQLLCKQDEEINDKEFKHQKNMNEMTHKIQNLEADKKRLDLRLRKEEEEHSATVENIKNKLRIDFQSQVDILSKQQAHQLDSLHYQNAKLKQVIDYTNSQLRETLEKQNKLKNNYQNTISAHQQQKDRLKQKIVENQHIAEIQISNFKEKMQALKEKQIKLLMKKSSQQCSMLNREIQRITDLLRYKQQQLECLMKQKKQTRSLLEAELSRVKVSLDRQQRIYEEAKNNFEGEVRLFEQKFDQKNKQILAIQKYNQTRMRAFQEEKQVMNEMISLKQRQVKELKWNNNDYANKLAAVEQQLKNFTKKAADEKQKLQKDIQENLKQIHRMNGLKLMQLQRKNDSLIKQNEVQRKYLSDLQKSLALYEIQVQVLQENALHFASMQRNMRSQAKQNASKWSNRSEEQLEQLKYQFQGLNLIKSRQIEELKSIHDNKLRLLRRESSQMYKELTHKNQSLEMLKAQYQRLMAKFESILQEQSVRKEKDLKIPGFLPKELAMKSVFDVFVKNKVLEYCF